MQFPPTFNKHTNLSQPPLSLTFAVVYFLGDPLTLRFLAHLVQLLPFLFVSDLLLHIAKKKAEISLVKFDVS